MRDLLVAGGGPVGLAVALYAAGAGLDVEVREPRPGPVDKACGEGLMPGAVADLAELGVDPPGHRLAGIRYLDGTRTADAPFRHGDGRGVRRTTLHRTLTDAVAAAGVKIVERAVGEVENRDGHVLVDDEPVRYLVAADGLHSPVRRMLGLDRPPEGRRRFGLRVHVELAPWTPYVEVHWAAGVEAYVTPVATDLVGVALLTSARGSFDDHLARFPSLASRLDSASPLGEVMGAGPLRQRARARVAGRVLLVGDSGGYVDALTGEGVALGLAQARAAVSAIVDGDPLRYEREWRTLTRRYRLMTGSLLAATRISPVRRMLVPTAARLPAVFGVAVNALARPA
jgi:flavin-dependent dehydrogenase